MVGGGASDSQKVSNLAKAQVEILLHAMRLPNLQVVAYSTCSVFREENEDVVLEVLRRQSRFRCARAIPSWPHRGLDNVPEFAAISPLVCRATYEKDGTNGFFVARFEKITGEVEVGARSSTTSSKSVKKSKNKNKKRDAYELSTFSTTALTPPPLPPPKKVKKDPCAQFTKRGFCKFGPKCRFSHETSSAATYKDDVDDLMEEWNIINEMG